MGQYNTVLAEQQLVGWQGLLVLNSGEHYIAGLGGRRLTGRWYK